MCKLFRYTPCVRRIGLILSLLLVVGYFPARPYLEATAVLRRIENPTDNSLLANYGTHKVSVALLPLNTPSGTVRARIYTPEGVKNPAALVLVHGVHHLGIDEPRMVNFARTLASHGVIVMTPELPRLADYTVDATSEPIIGAAVLELASGLHRQRVGLMGLSFAGGLSLIAATDAQFAPHISYVVAIGPHDDLERVMRFFATDTIAGPDGAILQMPAHEYGPLVVAYSHPEDFFPPEDVAKAHEALRLLLWEHGKDSEAIMRTLSPAGQRLMQAFYQQHREQFDAQMLAHLDGHRAAMRAASPAGKMQRIACPVLLLHGAGDNVIPPTETEWLAREIPPHHLRAVLISPAISHVAIGGPGPTLRDKFALVRWMKELLSQARE